MFKVKNWNEFQHFKDRTPPWIKLHKTILERRDIADISDRSFRVLVGIWLLASEDKDMEGNLPEPEEIAFRLRMDEEVIVSCLEELRPFLINDDIKPISGKHQDDAPETETETETDNTDDFFEVFWKIYPSRSPHPNPKKPAKLKFAAAIKRGVDPQTIIDGATRYVAYVDSENVEPQFIKQAVTWLNQECWGAVIEIKKKAKW